MFGITGIIAGIIMIIIGGILAFFFPGAGTYQPDEFGIVVVVAGFVMIILGAILIFI